MVIFLRIQYFCDTPGLTGPRVGQVAAIHELVDGVEEEDSHGEEEERGQGPLVHGLGGVGSLARAVSQVLVLEWQG